MVATDGADVVFDTDERLFTVTDGPITGTITTPSRTATRIGSSSTNIPVNVEVDTLIASVNASATTVRGSFAASTSGSFGVAGLGWYNASGSYVHFLGPSNGALGTGGNAGLRSIAAYTFFVSAGGLYLKERVALQADFSLSLTTSLTLNPVTLNFYLLVGTFI